MRTVMSVGWDLRTMSEITVGCIGTGPDPENPSRHGHAMAYHHARGYAQLNSCRLVGCADIVPEHGRAFAETFDIPQRHVYEDYRELLRKVTPDVVSICTPPAEHADLVIGCAKGGVDAIHCEKPMADTWGACRRVVDVCEQHDVQITFNHQRRFGEPFRRAKELLEEGTIGELRRLEFQAFNLYDYGTHSFDLCNYYAGEATPEWILAQLDYRQENQIFGAHNENQGVAYWKYENGINGLAATGPQSELVDCHNRLCGDDGVIEIGPEGGPTLRYRTTDMTEWTSIDCKGEGLDEPVFIHRAIEDVVDSLRTQRQPALRSDRALRATKLAFGAWESCRQRGRVTFPLEIDDNPLRSMVEAGALDPAPRSE